MPTELVILKRSKQPAKALFGVSPALTSTAAGVGMYLVSDVSRKPRNTVSSSSGARTAVTVKRLRYVGVLMRMMRATGVDCATASGAACLLHA